MKNLLVLQRLEPTPAAPPTAPKGVANELLAPFAAAIQKAAESDDPKVLADLLAHVDHALAQSRDGKPPHAPELEGSLGGLVLKSAATAFAKAKKEQADDTARAEEQAAALRSVSDVQALRSEIPMPQSVGVAPTVSPDSELPPSLRGKRLVKGTSKIAAWACGMNECRDGRRFLVDAKSQRSLLEDGNALTQPAPLTYLHEDGDPRNAGYGIGVSCDGAFIYCDQAYWTEPAARDLLSGERGPVSPECRCEPLDPVSLEVLTPDSPLFVGPGNGWFGTAYQTNTFRPMKWIVFASLVPVGALKDLPPASLGAASTHNAPAAATRKENTVNPKLVKILGLPAAATKEQYAQALSVKRKELGLKATATEAQVLGVYTRQITAADSQGFDRPGILNLIRKTFKFPDVVDDDTLGELIDGALEGAVEGTEPPDGMTPAAAPVAPAPGAPAAPAPGAPAAPGAACPPEDMKTAATAALRALLPEIVDSTVQTMSTRQQIAEFDTQLLAAEKDGIVPSGKREYWRKKYAADPTEALAELAAARPSGPGSAGWLESEGAGISGSDQDESLSVDGLPKKQADEILSRAAKWARRTGQDYEAAFLAVRKKDAAEAAYHRQLLRSDPEWMQPKRRGVQGPRYAPQICASAMGLHRDFDPERLKHVFKAIEGGKVSTSVIPGELQKAALAAHLESQRLGGEMANYQPPTKFAVPGLMFGFYQGTYGGDEIAVLFEGGANDKAYYPLAGRDNQIIKVDSTTGLPVPISERSSDPPTFTRKWDFREVGMNGYRNIQKASRRSQSAAAQILPIGLLAQAASDAYDYGRNERELIQSSVIRDASNYNSANKVDFTGSGRQWNKLTSSTPIQDHAGARMAIWRATGVNFSDIVTEMPPDVVNTLTFHPQLLTAAQQAGVGSGNPYAYVPLEMLVAVFGTIVSPTCQIGTARDESDISSPWGQDVVLSVTSRGKIVAPRGFVTVQSAGFPQERTLPFEQDGLIGSDGCDHADLYGVTVAGEASTPTQAAFLIANACEELTVVAP